MCDFLDISPDIRTYTISCHENKHLLVYNENVGNEYLENPCYFEKPYA